PRRASAGPGGTWVAPPRRLACSRSSPPWSVGGQLTRLLRVLAQPVPRETADRGLLARLGPDLVEQALDRRAVVLHEGLVQQHGVLEERLELALHDPRDHLVRLARFARLRLEDPPLVIERVRRDVITRQPSRRGRAGDVERQVLDEGTELVGVRDEVRL